MTDRKADPLASRRSTMLSKLYGMAIEWFRYYIVFSKGASFIFGLILSQGLVEYAVAGMLMSYLANSWKRAHLSKAAAVINVKEGVSTVLVIVAAHISDAYLGRFVMVHFSTAAYISGLVLLWLGEEVVSNVGLLYAAMMLIALGIAGRDGPLKAFLADQLRELEPNSNIDEERVEARRKVWWRFAWFSGAAISAFVLHDSWAYTFKISAITMGVAYLLLWSGTTFYCRKKPTGSPITIVYRVFTVAIFKKHLDYPTTADQLFKNDDDKQLPLLPHIPFFRWLDKAAIVETSSLSQLDEQEKKGKICTVAQVIEVKVLLKMVPMWTTFLVYSLVEATGSTFFIEQTTNLNDHLNIGNTFTVPIETFFVIKSFSSFAIAYMYELLVPKLWGGANRQRTMLVRIASGMVCSILCCITAWLVEVHRLRLVRIGGLTDNSQKTISMSIFWLAPQFCLLGVMEGLAAEGLHDFFYDHVDESMRSYGPPFVHCVLGIGKFISIPCVLLFRSWFKDTLDESHLDQYYIMLAMLSLVNLCFYCYVSNKYGFKEAPVEEFELDALLEEGFTSLVTKFVPVQSSSHHRSLSWTTGILSSFSSCSHYKVARVVVPIRSKTFS